MFRYRLLFLGLVLAGITAHAEVREIAKMAEALPLIKPGTLVVFDIDNTILEPRQVLGSDQWFEHQLQVGREKGMDEAKVIQATGDLWTSVQKVTRVRPVERTTPALISKLEKDGYQVIALTSRPGDLVLTTRKQLKSIGVEIPTIVAIGPKGTKGEALVRYLHKTKLSPRKIVFIDDKERNVKSVDESLSSLRKKIEHYGLRYGGADAEVAAYNDKKAQAELVSFERTHKLH